MRFLGLEIEVKNSPSRRSSNPFDEKYWENNGTMSISGARVTPEIAMQVAAINACVRVIAETIASLPLILYKKDKAGKKERATDHSLFKLLHFSPNSYMTRFEWVEMQVRNLLLRGNAYSYISIKNSEIDRLIPLNPDNMTPRLINSGNEQQLVYDYYTKDGKQTIGASYISHLKGPSSDGILGRGPIQETREVVGNAIALDRYQNFFYANGVRLSGVLEHPGVLEDEANKRVTTSFREAYAGASNSGKVAVLEEGMKFVNVSMTPRDAEFIESRKFSVTEIARIFRVPPHMIADLAAATYSNIESEFISFVVHTIRPWTVRIEQALANSLLTEDEAQDHYIEFLLDGLLRGDIESRYRAYLIGLQNGFLKINDVREKENMNSLDWGDATMMPLNMRLITGVDDVKNEPVAEKEPQAARAKEEIEKLTKRFEPLLVEYWKNIAARDIAILDKGKDLEKIKDYCENTKHESFLRSYFQELILAFRGQLEDIAIRNNIPFDILDNSLDYFRHYLRIKNEILSNIKSKEELNSFIKEIKSSFYHEEARNMLDYITNNVFQKEDLCPQIK